MSTLIEELYTLPECEIIKSMYSTESEDVKKTIVGAIGTKAAVDKTKILTTNSLDVVYMICLTSKFANSIDECHWVAITVHQHFASSCSVIPMFLEDTSLVFATKAFLALSFYAKILESRQQRKGAPSPAFYRQTSKSILASCGRQDVVSHYEQWEAFLGEMFV